MNCLVNLQNIHLDENSIDYQLIKEMKQYS